jgi:hypothetical protein
MPLSEGRNIDLSTKIGIQHISSQSQSVPFSKSIKQCTKEYKKKRNKLNARIKEEIKGTVLMVRSVLGEASEHVVSNNTYKKRKWKVGLIFQQC